MSKKTIAIVSLLVASAAALTGCTEDKMSTSGGDTMTHESTTKMSDDKMEHDKMSDDKMSDDKMEHEHKTDN